MNDGYHVFHTGKVKYHMLADGELISHSSLDLLHAFYSEGLVDNRTFLSWIVQQMSTCNLAQTGFVARLADEYFEGMLFSRALSRPFVEACLARLKEVLLMFSLIELWTKKNRRSLRRSRNTYWRT